MWYRPEYTRRMAISLDVPASSPVDANVTIPKGLDDFWTNIDTSGNELRVVHSDSETVLNYSIDDGAGGAFSKTNRLGRLQLDGVVTPSVAGMQCLWLYYNTTSTQGSGAVATTITSARNGYIELSRPSGPRRYVHRPQLPGGTYPIEEFHKTAVETVPVWVHYSGSLAKAGKAAREAALLEELYYCTLVVEDTGAGDVATMYDITRPRFVWHRPTGMWIRFEVKAGTTATDYTGSFDARTILPGATALLQRLDTRIGIRVRTTRIT